MLPGAASTATEAVNCRRRRANSTAAALPVPLRCRVGPAAGAAAAVDDWPALIQAALTELFGVIGGALTFSFEADPSSSGSAGVLTLDKR